MGPTRLFLFGLPAAWAVTMQQQHARASAEGRPSRESSRTNTPGFDDDHDLSLLLVAARGEEGTDTSSIACFHNRGNNVPVIPVIFP